MITLNVSLGKVRVELCYISYDRLEWHSGGQISGDQNRRSKVDYDYNAFFTFDLLTNFGKIKETFDLRKKATFDLLKFNFMIICHK